MQVPPNTIYQRNSQQLNVNIIFMEATYFPGGAKSLEKGWVKQTAANVKQ